MEDKAPRTELQTNAIIALGILGVMFCVVSALLMWVVVHIEELGCTGTELLMALVALMVSCVGGTVWVVKKFAESNGDKEVKKNQA